MLEQFVIAGLVYLIGISIVLTIKPNIMFTEDGVWKEFGIGRNPATHTWMPFWLFAILWAIISYILVSILFIVRNSLTSSTTSSKQTTNSRQTNIEKVKTDTVVSVTSDDLIPTPKPRMKSRARGQSVELPDGYYILNSKATEEAGGIPKYIFLGKGLPDEE